MHSTITVYGSRIFDLDVGMHRGNMPQALLISEEGISGVSAGGRALLLRGLRCPLTRNAR
jgi:hypothetical protein